MEGLFIVGLTVVGLVVFDVLALRFGADSRPGSPDPRQPAGGLEVI